MADDKATLIRLITIKDIEKAIEFPNAAKDEFSRLLVAGAVGVTSDAFERQALLKQADVIVTDIHMVTQQEFFRKIAEIRAHFPERTLIAGNIATAGARLYDVGGDVVKAGTDQVQFAQHV